MSKSAMKWRATFFQLSEKYRRLMQQGEVQRASLVFEKMISAADTVIFLENHKWQNEPFKTI